MTSHRKKKRSKRVKNLMLDTEDFVRAHRHLNPGLLVEHVRTTLTAYHAPPEANFEIRHVKSQRATVRFKPPHPGSVWTLARKDFTEKAAIVMAGVLLSRLEGKVIAMVTEFGDRADYFVGEAPEDCRWLLEVSGTEAGSVEDRLRGKKAQLLESRYMAYPYSMAGYVAVTRFAPEAVSALERVASRRKVGRRG